MSGERPHKSAFKWALVVLAVAGFGVLLWSVAGEDLAAFYRDREALAGRIQSLGFWGPLVIALLRAAGCMLAVVPTSPVLLAAGAAYGQLWGSIYVLIGAVLGAVTAFLAARTLGYQAIERRGWIAALGRTRFGRWLLDGRQSQGRLMLAVFLCRVTPFVNLDAMSYVAGVTPLRLWRFALATFGGLLPYTILLVSLGHELMEGNPMFTILLLAIVAGLAIGPIAFRFVRRRGGSTT